MARERGREIGDRTRGPGRARTRFRRVLGLMAGACAWLGVVVVVGFVVGRVMTDRTHATQYLWWIPALWSVCAAWGLLAVSALAGWASRRMRGVMVRPLLLAACVVMTLWVGFGEWHVQRAVLGSRPAPRERTLRLMHWNLSAAYRAGEADDLLIREDPDIACVVNARYDRHRRALVEAMGAMGPRGETEIRLDGRIRSMSEPGYLYSSGMALVASRERILRAGVVRLEPLPETDQEWRTSWDPGFVVWCEIEPGERFASLGRPLVVWVVDFPSDPRLWRMRVCEAAREAVLAWNEPAMVCDAQGRWRPQGEPVRVPMPDVVMGDFNALRGSASVERMAPGMADAFDAAGWGRAGSWKQTGMGTSSGSVVGRAVRLAARVLLPIADWHIDLCRVGDAWRATGYRLVKNTLGPHAAQVVEIVPAE